MDQELNLSTIQAFAQLFSLKTIGTTPRPHPFLYDTKGIPTINRRPTPALPKKGGSQKGVNLESKRLSTKDSTLVDAQKNLATACYVVLEALRDVEHQKWFSEVRAHTTAQAANLRNTMKEQIKRKREELDNSISDIRSFALQTTTNFIKETERKMENQVFPGLGVLPEPQHNDFLDIEEALLEATAEDLSDLPDTESDDPEDPDYEEEHSENELNDPIEGDMEVDVEFAVEGASEGVQDDAGWDVEWLDGGVKNVEVKVDQPNPENPAPIKKVKMGKRSGKSARAEPDLYQEWQEEAGVPQHHR